MSVKLITQAFGLDVQPNLKLLLVALADIANDEGDNVYPSVAFLVWKTSLSERTVRYMMKQLRESGALIPLEREGGGRRRTVVYRLDLEVLPAQELLSRAKKGLSPMDVKRENQERKGAGGAPFRRRGR